MNLSKYVDVTTITTGRNAATTKYTSKTYVDMQGFDGCMFIIDGSSLLQHQTASSFFYANVYGCSATAGTFKRLCNTAKGEAGAGLASSQDDAGINYRIGVIDVYRPEEKYRYLKCVVSSASSGAGSINNIIAVRYGARRPGSSQLMESTRLFGSTVLVSPATS